MHSSTPESRPDPEWCGTVSPEATRTHTDDEGLDLPFRPRARLLQLLGDELIGSPRLAVFELIKNAYDADARNVRVVLDDISTRRASIVVEDDGSGMTLETIRDIWLVPGHDHRAKQRKASKRTRLNRLPLGEKGLGRFAAHKLGNRIELTTRATGNPEYVVSIDWASLIRKKLLSDAPVHVTHRRPQVFRGRRSGTRITIRSLRETRWTRGEVRRLQRQITSISSPFDRKLDKFRILLEVPDHPEWSEDVPDIKSLLKRAPWQYRFSFESGEFDWKYRFRGVPGVKVSRRDASDNGAPLLIRQVLEERKGRTRTSTVTADASFSDGIGRVRGTFYVFDRDQAVLNRLGESQLTRQYLDDNGGVRVYRDGIRVYNYGEENDDWLELDLRRVNKPTMRISRNIVVGAVDLSLEDSTGLKEKTNREGFVQNDAERRLRQIVLGALTPLEVERDKDKDKIRRLTTPGRDRELDRIRRPLDELRKAARKNKVSDKFDPIIDKVERDYNELRDSMLRAGLSGMGLAIVFHEVEQGVRSLCDLIESRKNREAILTRARELSRVLGGFTDLLRKGSRAPHSLKRLIRRVRDINAPRFRKHGIRLHCPALEDEGADVKSSFVFNLALGALNNLLDNAFYWLTVRWPEGKAGRAIHIDLDPDFDDGPAIIVADTGPGFIDDPDDLVRPFFSRRPEGMGVGLYYVNLVMDLSGGALVFPDASEAGVPARFDGAVVALVFPEEED